MKVVIIFLLSITAAVCELPPYLSSSFRSQPFLPPFSNPLQTNYGPPKLFLTSSPQIKYGPPKTVDFFDGKLRPTNIPGRYKENQNLPPRTNYGVPITENIIHPQNSYRTPSTSKDSLNCPKFYNIINGPRILNQHQEGPQATYGAPSKFVQSNFLSNSIQQKAPQQTYGAPSVLQQSAPQSTYNAPSKFSHNNQEFPQSNYRSPLQQQNSGNSPTTLPQNNYNVAINSPETQYRAPSTNNIETLNRLKALISVFDKEQLNTQYLPSKEPNNFQTSSKIFSQSLPLQQPTQFRDNNISEQQDKPFPQLHLPVKGPNDFRKGFEWTQNIHNTGGIPAPIVPTHLPGNNLDLPIDNGGFSGAKENNVEIQQLDVRTLYPPLGSDDINQNQADISNQSQLRNNNLHKINNLQENKYLMSTTTSSPVINKPTTSTRRPDETVTPNEEPADTNQKAPSTDVNNASGPNVAVATAVAGAHPEQQFYLVQPDGRLQRVVYQQTKQPGDAENEYVADYYFQNIQSEPNVVYAPLITLG